MRVLLTRPQTDAGRVAARLAARGHAAVIAPVTAIVPTGAPAPRGPFDGLILTSAHAGPSLAALHGLACPVFAVGARTAAAAAAAGLTETHAAAGDAAALARLVMERVPSGGRLLHAAARQRKPEPDASLRAAGYDLVVWECYEAQAVPQLPEPAVAALGAGDIDAVLHFSRRSAALLVDLARAAELLPVLKAIPHLCLSADVAAPLRAIGAEAHLAAAPREEALFAVLDAMLG
jgi:uroporphyrinogen-III synthase